MILIAGLGNPGDRYDHTRHNIGFQIVDHLNEQFGNGNWGTTVTNLHAQVTELDIYGHRVMLAKPQTYMNASGDAVYMLAKYHELEEIWVVHDDVDLPFGSVRVRHGGGSGGHKGIESIDQNHGPDYWRIRLGVGRPNEPALELADYVLSPFTEEEKKLLPRFVDQVTGKLVEYINETIRVESFDAKKEPTKEKPAER